MGGIRGEMAEKRGMTIDEFNALGETESFTDKEVDNYQEDLGRSGKDFIIDGRVSWHFIPNSFKIFLDVDPNESAKRIFEDFKNGNRRDEEAYTSADEVKERIQSRIKSNQKRYLKYYGVDYLDQDNYDLVIDTTNKSPEEIIEIITRNQPTAFETRRD